MPKTTSIPKTASISVSLPPEIKTEAERIFGYQGFTLPEAVTVFIHHACHAGGFPFDLKGEQYTDPESMEALREAIQLMNNPTARRFRNVKELFDECLDDDDE